MKTEERQQGLDDKPLRVWRNEKKTNDLKLKVND